LVSQKDGHYRGCTVHRRLDDKSRHERELGKALLAHYLVSTRRDRFGHIHWRLAHCPHHGTEDHEVETCGRFLRRKRRGDNPVRNRSRRNTGKYNSHDHGGNRRRGSGAPFIRRSMGSCPPNRVGLDAYHSSLGHSSGGHICSNAPFPCESLVPTCAGTRVCKWCRSS